MSDRSGRGERTWGVATAAAASLFEEANPFLTRT